MRFTDISMSMIAVLAVQLRTTAAWVVDIYLDDLCSQETGVWAYDAGIDCVSFDAGLPQINSIKASGDGIGARCGVTIVAYEDYGCTGTSWELANNICLEADVGDAAPLKSFLVVDNPCD